MADFCITPNTAQIFMWELIMKDWPFFVLNLGAFITIIFVTWLWARTRFVAELAKYQTQIATLQLQRNDQLFALEDDCKAKLERVRLIFKDLKTQLHLKNVAMVNARRNELSNVFVLDYLPAMQKYVRLADEMFEYDRSKRRQFIENHVNPFLQFAGDLQETMNLPNLLNLLGAEAQPIRFSYMDFDFAADFIRRKGTIIDFALRLSMKQHIKRLGFQRDMKVLN